MMKMTNSRRPLALILSLALALALTAGCQGEPNYPVWAPMNTTGVALAEGGNAQFTFSYPEELWFVESTITPLTLMYLESYGTSTACNVNIQRSQASDADLTQKDLDALVNEFKTNYPYIDVTASEMRLFDGDPVMYLESSTEMTDEFLDLMIEQGIFTEADIEAMGGREALKAIPPTSQVIINAVCDGYVFTITGTYYNDSQKQATLDLITVLMDTLDA